MQRRSSSARWLVGVISVSVLLLLVTEAPPPVVQSGPLVSISRAPGVEHLSTTPTSRSAAQVVNATWENYQDSLPLPPGGSLYLFVQSVATSSTIFASRFLVGELASADSAEGTQEAAIAATALDHDSYYTNANHYSIAGAEISGTEIGSPVIQAETPPIEPIVDLNVSFTVSTSALVVFVAAAGGQCCVAASGIPGLTVLALESFPGGNAIEIAQANLTAGHYTIEEQSDNQDSGGTTWADLVGVFQFGASASTPDWTWVLVSVGIAAPLAAVAAVVVFRLRPKPGV